MRHRILYGTPIHRVTTARYIRAIADEREAERQEPVLETVWLGCVGDIEPAQLLARVDGFLARPRHKQRRAQARHIHYLIVMGRAVSRRSTIINSTVDP